MAKSFRVTIPRNVDELLKLADLIQKRHKEMGTESPLAPLSWISDVEKVESAMKLHLEAEALKRLAESKYEERDLLLAEIEDGVKQTRDFLKALYRNEPKKMGNFGFTVDDSPKQKK